MGKTTLTNKAGFNVQVKEGNSNIFRNLELLKPGGTMTIQADTNATYREYVLFLLPDNKQLRALTSDDIQEFPEVEIFKDEQTKEVDWRGIPGGAEKRSWINSILGWFPSKSGAKAGAKADATKAGSSKSPTAT